MIDLRVPYNQVIKLVDERLSFNDKAHGRKHINEVYTMAVRLIQELDWKINNDVVVLGLVYHDVACCIDRDTHHLLAAEAIEADKPKLLELGYTEEEIEHAKACVISHRNSWTGTVDSKEARMVRAADVGLLFENVFNALDRAYIYGKEKLNVSGPEGKARARKHIASKFGRHRMHTLDKDVYELYKAQWENMFNMLEEWEK